MYNLICATAETVNKVLIIPEVEITRRGYVSYMA